MLFNRRFEDVIPDSVIFLINAINASLPKLEGSNGASLLALATACVDNVLRIIEANKSELKNREDKTPCCTPLSCIERSSLIELVLDMLGHSFMADLQKAEKLHQATITSAGKLQPSLEALIADYKKIAPRQSDAKAHNDELHKLREERRQLLEQKNALTRQLRALQAND